MFALSTFLGRIFDTEPVWLGILEAPARLVGAFPFIFQLAFGFFFVIFQFIGLFWFLSRGGVDVYMPDDIETRFDDVKGQDAVLDRVKETMIFLEDPESIEEKGGYVPGGVLLWGPPGTGKTLMAQAVAGESARPFVFVEPGAFIQMFMGVGILKVKGLYRKLRRLALRYGGVIVFFDEADSLGNRGQVAQGGFARCREHRSVVDDAGLQRDQLPLPRWTEPGAPGCASVRAPDDAAHLGRPLRDGRDGRRWRRHGDAAGAPVRDVGPGEVTRPGEQVPQDARHEAEAPAQVPDPAHLRHRTCRRRWTRRCSARVGSIASTRSGYPRRTDVERRSSTTWAR